MARIEFATSGSAVRLATDCATGPGLYSLVGWFEHDLVGNPEDRFSKFDTIGLDKQKNFSVQL